MYMEIGLYSIVIWILCPITKATPNTYISSSFHLDRSMGSISKKTLALAKMRYWIKVERKLKQQASHRAEKMNGIL